jgi:hypothetical protein
MSKSQLCTTCLLLTLAAPLAAQTQNQCATWQQQHQRYTELRRAGGTLSQMDRWRDLQRGIETKMREAKCMQRFGISF